MKKFDQINVIPFIDIMLVLMAIVLLTASFSHNGKIDISLPVAKNAEAVEQKKLPKIISVNAQSEFFLNDNARDETKLDLEQIANKMQGWDKNQPILLKIDKNAAFESFVKISDKLKENNLKNISVLTEKRQ